MGLQSRPRLIDFRFQFCLKLPSIVNNQQSSKNIPNNDMYTYPPNSFNLRSFNRGYSYYHGFYSWESYGYTSSSHSIMKMVEPRSHLCQSQMLPWHQILCLLLLFPPNVWFNDNGAEMLGKLFRSMKSPLSPTFLFFLRRKKQPHLFQFPRAAFTKYSTLGDFTTIHWT